jgi:lysophospholipase L1-like esterase
VSAVSDIKSRAEEKIIVWGDSYVEAHQVDDNKKMAQQTTRLLAENRQTNLLVVGAGLSGQSVADYLLKIPVYEKQMAPVGAHVIVVGQMEDLFPDQASAHFSRFVSSPDMRIIPAAPRNPSHLKYLVYEWGVRLKANGALSVLRNFSDGRDLRFAMGPVGGKKSAEPAPPSKENMEACFRFLAWQFRQATDRPLVLLYAPTVPQLKENRWDYHDDDGDAAALMERIFRENGWVVINTGEQFIRCFETKGELPRGFNNSRPGSGHLNETGHRLVAETLAEYFVSSGTGTSAPTPDTREPITVNRM